jgi:hypothetical protein
MLTANNKMTREPYLLLASMNTLITLHARAYVCMHHLPEFRTFPISNVEVNYRKESLLFACLA